MLAIINNVLKIINIIEPNTAKLAVAVFNEVENPILIYELF